MERGRKEGRNLRADIMVREEIMMEIPSGEATCCSKAGSLKMEGRFRTPTLSPSTAFSNIKKKNC